MSHIRKIGKNYAIDFYWSGKRYTKSLKTFSNKNVYKPQHQQNNVSIINQRNRL
jgi:hypothetical protein